MMGDIVMQVGRRVGTGLATSASLAKPNKLASDDVDVPYIQKIMPANNDLVHA